MPAPVPRTQRHQEPRLGLACLLYVPDPPPARTSAGDPSLTADQGHGATQPAARRRVSRYLGTRPDPSVAALILSISAFSGTGTSVPGKAPALACHSPCR